MNVFQSAIVNWPEDEARVEAESMLEYSSEYSHDEMHQKIIKLRQHWIHVFADVELMNRFTHEFNRIAFDKLNIAI